MWILHLLVSSRADALRIECSLLGSKKGELGATGRPLLFWKVGEMVPAGFKNLQAEPNVFIPCPETQGRRCRTLGHGYVTNMAHELSPKAGPIR